MQVDKEDVAELLRRRGEHDKAAHVKCALPRRVDTEIDAGVLHQFDLNVSEVAQVARPVGQDGRSEPAAGTGPA